MPKSSDMYSVDEYGQKSDSWLPAEMLGADDLDEGEYSHNIDEPASRDAGDVSGHEFHGNQWSGGGHTVVREPVPHANRAFIYIKDKDGKTLGDIEHKTQWFEAKDGSAEGYSLNIIYASVPEGERGKGIGKELYHELHKEAARQENPYVTGEVTSQGVLRLRNQEFGEPVEIRDNDKTYTLQEAMALLDPTSPEKEGKIRGTKHKAFFVTSKVSLPKPRAAGDVEGHEFHGNQWSGGGGGGKSKAASAERASQASLAAQQTHPLAHPPVVIGMTSRTVPHQDVKNYVAAYGQEFTSAPLPAGVEKGPDNQCYRNASLLVMEDKSLDFAEGFAEADGLPGLAFQHAWAVKADGTVVDPTWKNPEKSKYFGVVYKRDAYLKHLYKSKFYGVIGATDKVVELAVNTGAKKLR
jgi:hypothetical protein